LFHPAGLEFSGRPAATVPRAFAARNQPARWPYTRARLPLRQNLIFRLRGDCGDLTGMLRLPLPESTYEVTEQVPGRPPRPLGCGSEASRINARPMRHARTNGEAAISITAGNPACLDEFFPEDDALIAAKRNAAEVGGAAPVSPATGGTLRFMAAAVGARSVVEIGTGCGASGIWLLRGMRPGAVLTSVDVEPEHQRLARAAFLAAGFPAARYRLIGGLALEVLPRLADDAYDMVFCDADRQEFTDYLTAALRLLRPGGIVIFNAALPGSAAGQRMPTDTEIAAAASLRDQVRADERLVPLLLPVSRGSNNEALGSRSAVPRQQGYLDR
jgi:predicted O-methyltransferase YrrM